jgi:uncharacterized protein (TIGR00730 family)
MKEKICVFASSSNKIPQVYFDSAKELGELIAKNGYDLVYGAGCVGTMYEIASNVKSNGGKVIGVIPKKLNNIGVDWKDCDEFIETECMASRKKKMRKLSDAFVSMPGGFGTLEEIAEVITLKQLGYHSKPVVFLDTNDFYTNLLAQFETFYSQSFAKRDNEKLYYIAKTPKDVINYIKEYEKAEPVAKWAR